MGDKKGVRSVKYVDGGQASAGLLWYGKNGCERLAQKKYVLQIF